MNKTPRCPLHVAFEMRLLEVKAPAWVALATGEDGEEEHAFSGHRRRERTRKFWKCPVENCHRVAAYSPAGEEEKKMAARRCPRCGAPSDADGINRAIGRSACRNCLREAQRLKKPRAHKARREHFEPQAEMERTEEAVEFAETLLDAWRTLPEKRDAQAEARATGSEART
jgi:hypothetical protein